MTVTQRVLMVLVIALACSLLLNLFAGAAYLKQRDALVHTRAQVQVAQDGETEARETAAACSASIDSLDLAAGLMQLERDAARALAASKAKGHNARADAVLAAPAPVPGDACASAAARFADWQVQRKQEGGP